VFINFLVNGLVNAAGKESGMIIVALKAGNSAGAKDHYGKCFKWKQLNMSKVRIYD
jgi:hypothetical protein